jgi:hypothetical protein
VGRAKEETERLRRVQGSVLAESEGRGKSAGQRHPPGFENPEAATLVRWKGL